MTARCVQHCILPPSLLHRLARSDDDALRDAALNTLAFDGRFRLARAESAASLLRSPRPATFARIGGRPQRTIYDQQGSESQTPGVVMRVEGQGPREDQAVNQAYDGLGATYSFYWAVFERDSIDDAGMPLLGLTHYGQRYDNAFWDGAGHMFFGDGDGRILTQTTAGIDVIGHELTHGVTQHEANLTYSGQSGALNESVSDVFGIQVKQHALGQDVHSSDWLIGADIVGPALRPALRSMKQPGTANPYDDQPADMSGYVPGGDVHLNSGIPNRAFYVVATTLGGHAWDAAGPIWYAALADLRLRRNATFRDFARITLRHARQIYGTASDQAHAVQQGWEAVKVQL
ncbi:MAG: M4 family metallopeptidase [Pseudonocardiales bacterium]|nr:M4 family metallopeptidase [Pseudonocardiales bacterium]MBV9031239.1 M4 family metallopeptidase [Pseudonocardiales bacterium]